MFDLVVCETDPGPPISNSDFKLYMPGGGESKKRTKRIENLLDENIYCFDKKRVHFQ